jgi:hypothetical protein
LAEGYIGHIFYMKLTLKPTINPPREGIPSPTISIEIPDDDMTCRATIMDLVFPLLNAAYPSSNVRNYFNTDEIDL